jgi:hypothetical protein
MILPRPLAVLTTVAAIAASLAAAAPAAAQAEDFVARANAFYANIPQNKRSDLIILPAVAKIEEPADQVGKARITAELEGSLDPILYPTSAPGWPVVEAWLMAEPQRNALKALAEVTQDEGPTTHMVFAQPYGVEGVSYELVGADLYTELGDPPMLAAAQFRYLDGLAKLWVLAHAEANRLMAAGEGPEAMEVLLDWLFFSRQIADRELAEEKIIGMAMTMLALMHLRDLAYQDFQSPTHSLTPTVLADVIRRLDDKRGPLGIERIQLPRADRLAVEQLLYRIYDQSTRRPNDQFASTMAWVTSRDRPLRLFSEAARWELVRAQAAGWYEVQDALRNVANDFEKRWALPPRDPVLTMKTDYERTVRGRSGFAPIAHHYDTYPAFFNLRDVLRAEAAGTRMSLAMYAFYLQYNQYPRDLSAVRPAFAPVVDKDPYANGADILFFVPIRDQPKGPRGETQPHEIRVFPGFKYPNFSVRLRDDQFVIYSVGPDEVRGWARDATQGNPDYREGDYLFWPPTISLLRQHLIQNKHFN